MCRVAFWDIRFLTAVAVSEDLLRKTRPMSSVVIKAVGTPVAFVRSAGSTVAHSERLMGACPCLEAMMTRVDERRDLEESFATILPREVSTKSIACRMGADMLDVLSLL